MQQHTESIQKVRHQIETKLIHGLPSMDLDGHAARHTITFHNLNHTPLNKPSCTLQPEHHGYQSVLGCQFCVGTSRGTCTPEKTGLVYH